MRKSYLFVDKDFKRYITPVLSGTEKGFQPNGAGSTVIPWDEISEQFHDCETLEDFNHFFYSLWYLIIEPIDGFEVREVDEANLYQVDYDVICAQDSADEYESLTGWLSMMETMVRVMGEDSLKKALSDMEANGKSKEFIRQSAEQQMLYEQEEIKNVLNQHLTQCAPIFQEDVDWSASATVSGREMDGVLYSENGMLLGGRGPLLFDVIQCFIKEDVTTHGNYSGHFYIPLKEDGRFFDLVYHG